MAGYLSSLASVCSSINWVCGRSTGFPGAERGEDKNAVCKSALGELTGGGLKQRAQSPRCWEASHGQLPEHWPPQRPHSVERAPAPRASGTGPGSSSSPGGGSRPLLCTNLVLWAEWPALLSARSGLSPSGDEVICTASNLGPVPLGGGQAWTPLQLRPSLGAPQAASSEDEGSGHHPAQGLPGEEQQVLVTGSKRSTRSSVAPESNPSDNTGSRQKALPGRALPTQLV